MPVPVIRGLETPALWAVLGPIAPLGCLLTCWWGTLAWLPEEYVRLTALFCLFSATLALSPAISALVGAVARWTLRQHPPAAPPPTNRARG